MPPGEPALLRLPGFTRFACSAMLNTVAFAGEQVVLGWLVLDLTNSPLLVGVALALRMAPLLVVGLPAGVLADRGDRLVLLRGANTTMALGLRRSEPWWCSDAPRSNWSWLLRFSSAARERCSK